MLFSNVNAGGDAGQLPGGQLQLFRLVHTLFVVLGEGKVDCQLDLAPDQTVHVIGNTAGGEGNIAARPVFVQKPQKGAAGELYGVLTKTAIGSITKNTAGGVYGKSDKSLKHLKSYPVAQPKEVRRGKATVLTTVDERGVQAFEVNIQFINIIGTGYKDMIVKVTDEKLLEKTGGILQGMSGSPIIQNGKFVGALTHVFLNRPELGYAVFGYKMVNLAKQ